jgi:hypothetical protein
MLNTKLISALVLTAAAGATQAAGLPSAVWFDGYCDGITGITNTGSGTYAGQYDEATNCGGTNVAAGGPLGKKMFGTGKGAAFTVDSYATYGISVAFVVNLDKTWTLYDTTGAIWNYGTWSAGAEAKPHGGVSTLAAGLRT